jgi:YfiH family protein
MSHLTPILSPQLNQMPGLAHGFFTRQGGVSQGIYASLNIGQGSQDDPQYVAQNRDLICAHLGGQRLISGHQIHSARAVYVGAHDTKSPRADALVTDQPGLVLGVLSADCVPVLLADPQGKVIATAHAGWRGAYDNVIANVVELMEQYGAQRENIVAVVGPAISKYAYEVGPEFVHQFADRYPDDQNLFTPSQTQAHQMFDLTGFVLRQLARAQVRAELLNICTYWNESEFFSYRRSTHRAEPDYGRQLSALCLHSK